MRKSANMIDDAAVEMITGIENIEIFLEENDQWQFHDSGISDIHWDDKVRRLDITVCPTFCKGIEYDYKTLKPILDFHFTGVYSVKLEFNGCGYVDEISIKGDKGFLDTWFDCYTLNVTSRGLIVDKPRFVPRKDD